MKAFKKTLVMAVALPLVIGSASAMAFGGKGGDDGHRGGKGGCDMDGGKRILRQLDLTDEQKDQLKDLRQANREEMRGQRGEQRTAKLEQAKELQALMLAENFDEAQVRALATKMTEDQVERRVEMLEKRHQMLNILTPEQKVKYQELQAEKFERCETRMAEKAAKMAEKASQ